MKQDNKDDDFIKFTYGDTKKDEETGEVIPGECALTDYDNYFNKERLDYIILLDQAKDNET